MVRGVRATVVVVVWVAAVGVVGVMAWRCTAWRGGGVSSLRALAC